MLKHENSNTWNILRKCGNGNEKKKIRNSEVVLIIKPKRVNFKLLSILMIKKSWIIERRSPLFANREQKVKASNLKWAHPLCYNSPSDHQIQQLLIHYVSCTGPSHISLTVMIEIEISKPSDLCYWALWIVSKKMFRVTY